MIRGVVLVAGLLVLAAAWSAPLFAPVTGPFSAHMSAHVAVVAVAAPLIALGLAGGALDPVRRWPAWLQPVPLSMLELVVVWAWHAPGWHDFARHSAIGSGLEQASFLACGLLVWISALGGTPLQRRRRRASGLIALLLTSTHMTLLGALLALAPRPLYAHVHQVGALGPLADQHLGGAIMLVIGGLSYLAGGLWLTAGLLSPRGRASVAPRLQGRGGTAR